MKIVVKSAISEAQLEVLPKTTGRELFGLMCKTIGLAEVWYFGLMFKGADNEDVWIDESKKKLKEFQNYVSKLKFRIKYYPENVDDELIETITIDYFFRQIKQDILADRIFCPADTSALLASYALQVKFGDCESNDNIEKILKKEVLLPERVEKQHKMHRSDWEETIKNMWKKHKGLDKEDAMLEYLKLVQNLEMYGNTYFYIRNKKGTDLILGVNALGLDFYKPEDKLNPQISFPWSEIKKLNFKDKKFTIKPTDRGAADFVFFTSDGKICKNILKLGVGNHVLYVKRRKPDTLEIAKMKEKAQEMRKNKRIQKQKYDAEKLAREEAEKRELDYKNQIEQMREEMQRSQAHLLEAQMTIKRLQEQLEDLQRSKEELEYQRLELQEMMERLEQSKNMEAAQKQKLEDEIRAKHDEVMRIQEEVRLKDEETRRLQEAVEEARRKEEEARQRQIEESLRLEDERKQREIEEAARKDELEAVPEGADVTLPQFSEVNEQLKDQLKALQAKLESSKSGEEETELDKIHRENVRLGRDKFKTLADIRRGNTVRRVEMFENM